MFAQRTHPNFRELSQQVTSADRFREHLDNIQSSMSGGGRRVVLIDRVMNFISIAEHLRFWLEEENEQSVAVLCASAPWQIPASLENHLQSIRLVKADLQTLTSFASRTLTEIGWSLDAKAIEVIVEQSEGCFTRGARLLERAYAFGAHSAHEVGRAMDESSPQVWSFLLAALQRQSLAHQINLLRDMPGSAAEKVSALHELLGAFFQASHQTFDKHRILRRLPTSGQHELKQALDALSDKQRYGSHDLWVAMLNVWTPRVVETGTTLLERLLEFDGVVDPNISRIRCGHATKRRRKRIEADVNDLQVSSETPSLADEVYLDFYEVKAIWDTASYIVQQTGHYLNTHIEMTYRPDAEHAVGELVRQLGRELTAHLRRQRWTLAWVYVHETSADQSLTHIAASLPENEGGKVIRWLRSWSARHEVSLAVDERDVTATELNWHMVLVRMLSEGLSPRIKQFVFRQKSKYDEAPLRELLGLRKDSQRFVGAKTTRRRVGSQQTFDLASREEDQVRFFSAFDRGLWEATSWGRDMKEFEERKAVRLRVVHLESGMRDLSPTERCNRQDEVRSLIREFDEETERRLRQWATEA